MTEFFNPLRSAGHWFTLTVLLLSALTSNLVHASDDSKLIIETKLLTEGPIYAKQPVTISVTVLNNRWFSKGTRLGRIEIDNAIVLTTSDYAINSTRKVNYETWSTQTRDITFYPMKAGPLSIPEFKVDVSTNSTMGEEKTTVLYTEPMELMVELPPGVDEKDEYVISSHYAIDVELLGADKEEFKVGDAITQNITMTVDNSPGMMLPVPHDVELPGVKVYRKPPEVKDRTDRGMITGSRIESFTYFFESAGTYTIPKQTFYWFNTNFNELEEISIDEYTITVIGKTGVEKAVDEIKNFNFSPAKALLYLGFVLAVIFLLVMLVRHYQRIISFYKKLTKYEQRQLNGQFIKAFKLQEYRLACHYLYQRFEVSNNSSKDLARLFANEPEKLTILRRLFRMAFEQANSDETISLVEAKSLLALSTVPKRKLATDSDFGLDDFIDLNKR